MSMEEKNFTYTLTDVPENFKKIPGGAYKDEEIDIAIDITNEKETEIKFSILINKCPNTNPFWAVLYIQVQGQETKFFIVCENSSSKSKGKRFQTSFNTPFTSDIFTNNTTITYKIKQNQSYICKLTNDGCVCYLNCVLQLLFHLSKFRDLILSTYMQNKPSSWLYHLKNLFEKMCSCKTCLSTEDLTESFGWPSTARHITHDATEFMQILLNSIRNNNDFGNWKEKIDKIFASQLISNPTPPDSESKIENRYIFYLPRSKDKTIEQMIEEDLNGTQFLYFPEVLLISPNRLSNDKLPTKLDLTKLGHNTNIKHSKYTLSGIILLIFKPNGINHYTCFVRGSNEEVWLYFSDSIGITYSWKYKRNLNKIVAPLDHEIPNKLKMGQIHFLMYIADDVINEYFTYSPALPLKRQNSVENNEYNGPNRKIMITTNDDIEKYVQSGHTDFELVGNTLTFEIEATNPYSSVYDRVSREFNVPTDSFLLRTEGKGRSPSFHEFPNKSSPLRNIRRYTIHLYYEIKPPNRPNLCQFIPFYFLLFRFNSKSYLHNIHDNLTHPDADNLLKSTPLRQRFKDRIQRTPSNNINKNNSSNSNDNDDNNENDENNSKKTQEKNCFHYLTSIVLNTNNNFESVIENLLKIINERDKQKKHEKISLFTAVYSDDECKEKTGYKRLDLIKKIKESHILNGTYIYVQCDDDFLSNEIQNNDKYVESKFLFFKYMNQVYENKIYPKEISNVYMIENYAIPVTFCKLSDPKNKQKTMLFPIKAPIQNVKELKKIICAAMNEKYPENGLMQLFFGFKSENWPPFHEQIIGEKSINSVTSILNHSLQSSTTILLSLNLSPNSSIQSLLNKIEESKKDKIVETDTQYKSNIFIHYHIFEKFVNREEISVRVYFSKNSISIDFISQVKVPIDSKVNEIIMKLTKVFENQLDDDDKQKLLKYENSKNDQDFYNDFRILQTSNGKISRDLKLNFSLSSSMEVRIERIQKNFDNNDLEGFIPVFYGARYNPKKEFHYKTNYVGSVGTPFYLPVLKSDLIDQNVVKNGRFKYSNIYKRLKSVITQKDFELLVVNYFGMIQNVNVNDLSNIMKLKLNYSVCIRDLNASTFIDEVKFFNDGIRIIT